MSENQSNDKATSENAPTPHPCESSPEQRSHAIKGPHFASESPKVLARVPNLESAESELAGESPPAGEDGRMLSSRWSMRLLGVGGVALLVAALALPFLIGKSESPESASQDDSPAWGPDRPAPSAALAPAWDSPSDGASGWQLPSSEPQAPQAQAPAVSAWSEKSPPLDWDASSQAQAWDDAAKAPTWDVASGAETSTDQPATPGWEGRPDTALTDDRPQWNAATEDASAVWGGQGDVAVGAPSSDAPAWSTQPSPAPGVYREAGGAWNEEVQTPRWPAPQYRTAQQPQAPGTVWDGRTGSAFPTVDSGGSLPTAAANRPRKTPVAGVAARPTADDETIRPAASSYESSRAPNASPLPRINVNRSVRIHAYPEAGALDPGADQSPSAQPVYRAADARANPWSGAAVDDRSADQDTAGRSAFPTNGPPASTAPATSYPAYPPLSYPETQYPATQLPAVIAPDGSTRVSTYPAGDRPSTVDPRYGATDPSVGVSPAARHDAGGYPRFSQPGVARFRGGIEKPTGTEVHDDYRSSVY